MKKFLPYILMFTIIAGILAPFSLVTRPDNRLAIEKKEVWADTDGTLLDAKAESITNGAVTFDIKITWEEIGKNSAGDVLEKKLIISRKKGNNQVFYAYVLDPTKAKPENNTQYLNYTNTFTSNGKVDSAKITISNFAELSKYEISVMAIQEAVSSTDRKLWKITNKDFILDIPANSAQKINIDNTGGSSSGSTAQKSALATLAKTDVGALPACGFGGTFSGGGNSSFTGCIAQGLYYALYVPTSWMFGGAGTFFDFTFGYSVKSSSYEVPFVTEGWKIIRDLCNVFFIFILLYIAFALILGLHKVNAKEMLVNVIIIGLLINFSLFFTHVLIDSSNILARIFYNSEKLKEEIDPTASIGGAKLGQKVNDEISLSAGLISKINPQEIVRNASKIQVIDSNTGTATAGSNAATGLSAGAFILVTLLAVAVNVVGIIVFLSVGIVFVSRVIGLWFAMIFAPFAFLSYIVPSMAGIKMIGWKNWWSDLLAICFVAPLFMFLLYLIILFIEKGFGGLVINKNADNTLYILGIIIPFVFIMIMLMMAKKIAKEYSGTMGKSIVEGVSKVAGVAGGVALGAGAMASSTVLRGTVGRLGSAVANSDMLKGLEKKGVPLISSLRNIGKAAGAGSMDIRGAKIAGKGLGDAITKAGGKDMAGSMGKAKEGGFEKMKTDKIEKRVKRAKELEMGEGSEKKREASGLEANLRRAKAEKASSLSKVEKEITDLRQKMQDQKSAGLDADAAITYTKLESKQNEKKTIRGVDPSTGAVTAGGIADLETKLNKINDEINAAEVKSMDQYAKNMESLGNKTINYLTSFGQHSGVGANIAADRIRKGVKIEDKAK